MDIYIDDRQQKHVVDSEPLRQVAFRILAAMECDDRCELSIALVDDQEIHDLNAQYRGIDRPTDVLSFALQEADEPRQIYDEDQMSGLPLLLGDVILSTETTQRQAEERGHSFDRELHVLLIHGILHLLGYDHQTDEEANVMESLEQRLITQLYEQQ